MRARKTMSDGDSGGLVAIRPLSRLTSAIDGLRHYALDHLGSPRLLTDRCGERKKLFAYLPFGQEVPQPSASNPEDKERMRFTVHERDLGLLDTGADDLDYMHARTYGPAIGRFMSMDPVTGKPANPQSWNLFRYANNNPITKLDPDGRLDAPWHFSLGFWAAREAGYSVTTSLGLAWEDAWTDFRPGSQSRNAADTNIHDMIGWLSTEGRWQTTAESLQGASRSVDKNIALGTTRSIGTAMHTVEDPIPEHVGHQWPGFSLFSPSTWGHLLTKEYWQHAKGDAWPSQATKTKAYINTVVLLELAKQRDKQPVSGRDQQPEVKQHSTFQMEKGPVTNQ